MNLKAIFAIALLCVFTTNVQADEDDSFVNYDAIVNDLRASADTEPRPVREEFDWDEVALSGGLSLSGSFANFNVPSRGPVSGLMKGFEAHIGFNLFSKVARAEAAFSNYGQESLASNVVADMREYEARLVFLPFLQDKLLMRMGASLSERSISLHSGNGPSIQDTLAYYSLLLGCERKVSSNVSFGPDIAYHAPFYSSPVARSSWDTSLRLNATF
jgi:hypothetical protein